MRERRGMTNCEHSLLLLAKVIFSFSQVRDSRAKRNEGNVERGMDGLDMGDL